MPVAARSLVEEGAREEVLGRSRLEDKMGMSWHIRGWLSCGWSVDFQCIGGACCKGTKRRLKI